MPKPRMSQVLVFAAGMAIGLTLALPIALSPPTMPSARSDPPSRAPGGYRVQPSLESAGRPAIDIAPWLDRVSTRIKLPQDGAAGAPVSAATIGAADLPRDHVGLTVLYHGAVQLTAEADPAPFDPRTILQAASKEATGFADGRKAPFEIQSIDGIDVAVQLGGVQTTKISGDISLNAAVEWQENGVTYTLQSDVVDANALLGMMRSIHAQQ